MNFLKRMLVCILTVQFSLPHVYAQTPSEDPTDSLESVDAAAKIAADSFQSPEDRRRFLETNEIADAMDRGETSPLVEQTPLDVLHLANQRLELFEKGQLVETISLSDVQAKYADVVVTAIRPIYNSEKRELIFEGVDGIKADGSGGLVRARHVIPGIDMISMRHTNEFLAFTTAQGHVGLVDMGYVALQAFKNPIFVVDNVWKPKQSVGTLTQADVRFMVPGTNPLTAEAYTGYVYQRDEMGKPVYKNGAVRISYLDASGNEQVLALISRTQFYLKAQLAAAHILNKLKLVDPSIDLEKFLISINEEGAKSELPIERIPGSYDQALGQFVQNINPDQIANLKSRVVDLKNYSSRRMGTQTIDEAISQFEEIRTNFKQAQSKDELLKLDQMEQQWYKYVTPVTAESPFKTSFVDVLSKTLQKTTSLKTLGTVAGITAATILAFPYAYENIDMLRQVKLLNWFYLNALPDVLNTAIIPWEYTKEIAGSAVKWVGEAHYRDSMILNMVYLTMLWPAAHVTAWTFKKAVLGASRVLASSNTKFAGYMRDMARNWGHLGNWQVVTTFGMRVWSRFIFPVVRLFTEKLLRQHSLFTALENYQNPLQRIQPNSEIGRKLGLEKSISVGFNNPLVIGDKRVQEEKIRFQAQSLLKQETQRKSQMAFLLATLAASEQYGVDPATLFKLGDGSFKLEDLRKIFTDERKKKEWFLTAKYVYEMLKMDKLDIQTTMQGMPQAEFESYYKRAKAIATKVHSNSNTSLAAKTAWTRFKRAPYWLLNNTPFVSGGVKDYKFLNTVYTDNYVSGQVHKEFYIDHLMVVGIIALWPGADGRAYITDQMRGDFSGQENLAANPEGVLRGSGAHNNDTASNTYVHFFVTGAKQALVYQSIRALADSKESEHTQNNMVYDPFEDFKYLTADRSQGFLKGSWEWITSVLNFPKSTLGEIAIKGLTKRVTTLQAGFFTSILFQMALIPDRTLGEAFMAYLLMFSAGYWYYAWPWDLIQAGNKLIEPMFESRIEEMNIAKEKLLDAMKESNSELASQKIKDAYSNMLSLYQRENPGILKRLARSAKFLNSGSDRDVSDLQRQKILADLKNVPKTELMFYYGLLAQLLFATQMKSKALKDKFKALEDKSQAIKERSSPLEEKAQASEVQAQLLEEKAKVLEEQSKAALIKILNGENTLELKKLSAQGLFDLALSNAPLYNKPNSTISVATTLGAAIATTVMAIPLMQMLGATGENFPETTFILGWFVSSFAFYGAAYMLTGAKPWNFYLEQLEKAKEKLRPVLEKLQPAIDRYREMNEKFKISQERVRTRLFGNRSTRSVPTVTMTACQGYFK